MSEARMAHPVGTVRLAAVVLLALMAGAGALTVAMYNDAFTDTASVTVRADRAGLQMNKGTVVKLRGVDVGRIASAKPRGDGSVDIKLEIKPEMMSRIPRNVTVSLEQLTAFGNKAVVFELPKEPEGSLSDGDTVDARHVTVEANEVLDNLQTLLTTVKPSRVNTALGATATALDGRGDELGALLEKTHDYLARLNDDLPALRRNFAKGGRVLDLYADVTPAILRTLENGSVTARTITANAESIESVLTSLEAVGNSGGRFIALNGDNLIRLLSRLTTTTDLLERYSPEFACFLQGADYYQQIAVPAYGGVFASANVVAGLELGTNAYQNPSQLPNMTADEGPQCHGLPGYKGGPLPQSMQKWVDKGGPSPWPNAPELNQDALTLGLFGPLAGAR